MHVTLYCRSSKVKPLGDFLIGQAFPNEIGNFSLAFSHRKSVQSGVAAWHSISGNLRKERAGQCRWEHFCSFGYRSYGFYNIMKRCLLKDETGNACFHKLKESG